MTPKERTMLALESLPTDRPLFCPAVYEHKARLIEKSPSQVARSVELLCQAVLAEYETYRPDMLTVGIDIYNVEAEALGCSVKYPEGPGATPNISNRILTSLADLEKLAPIAPAQAGRMPLMLEAAEFLHGKLGDEIFVRGALSGPFSLAAELLGIEQLLMELITRPDEVKSLLEFCTQVIINYGREFLKRKIDVCVFDSQAAAPFVSPALYRDNILPLVRKLFAELKDAGATFVEYVVGGDNAVNAENLFDTGADVVLCDFVADIDAFLRLAKGKNVLVRKNINPAVIEMGSDEELADEAEKVARAACKHDKVIVGTGVISYNTPVEKVLSVRSRCFEVFSQE